MKFKALLIEDTEGCGNSIGCGLDVIVLKGNNEDEAINELKTYIDGMPRLKEIYLLKVESEKKIDVQKWYNDVEVEREVRLKKSELESKKCPYKYCGLNLEFQVLKKHYALVCPTTKQRQKYNERPFEKEIKLFRDNIVSCRSGNVWPSWLLKAFKI